MVARPEFASVRPELLQDEAVASELVSWMYECDVPFIDWLYGSPSAALAILRERLARPTSDAFASRVRGAFINGKLVGGYVLLTGDEVTRCAMADIPAAARVLDHDARSAFAARVRLAFPKFPNIEPDALLLSRIGVSRAYRKQGYGRLLLREARAESRADGHQAIHLTVNSCNHAAIQLYRSEGFVISDAIECGGAPSLLVMKTL